MHIKVASLLILPVFLFTACDDTKPVDETPSEPKVHLAKLLKVSTKSKDAFLNYPAIIKSQKLAILSFEVGGKVKEIAVKEAQKVKKGEVLARLDQQDLQSKIESARSKFNNTKSEYQRALRLLKGQATSQSDVDAKKFNRDAAKSSLNIAQKALKNAVLKAPYDGIVSLVPIKTLEVVQAGEAAIHMLGDGGLKATINIPSSVIAKSRKQEKPANNSYVVFDAAPKLQIPIVFHEISLKADTESQTYPVTFIFEEPKDLIILPGMNAVVWMQDPRQAVNTQKITVPLTAIASDGEQKYVWVVDASTMMVSKKNVVVESDVGTGVGIKSGLTSGETIVSAGISFLSVGMKVRAWSK